MKLYSRLQPLNYLCFAQQAIHSSLVKTVLLLFFILFVKQVTAQENNETALLKLKQLPYSEVKSGSLYFKHDDGYLGALTQNSDYQVEVNALLARVKFSQTFKNTSEQFLEAVYVFPLIDDAAVDSMVMEIGERRILGKIKEKQQAIKRYQRAKSQGKKASLVSQQRPNMFTTKVSNIAPGETIKITISYLQSVKFQADEFSLRIPLTITPRYVPINTDDENKANVHQITETAHISRTGWGNISPPQTRNSLGQKANIQVTLNTGLLLTNINSHYHPVVKQRKGDISYVALANKRVQLDRDFVLSWQVEQGNIPKAAFFKTADRDFNYGLLMIMPSKVNQRESFAKNVTYILDTSGSMGGVAIKQAKQALQMALNLLDEKDSFNIIAFNNDTETLFQSSRYASQQNIAMASQWLQHMSAGGGTNMYPAIAQALQQSQQNTHSGQGKYQQVIFITDGSVANEQALFSLIEQNLGDTRLHTIGIGSAPNSYFMSRAAEFGHGTYRYIGSLNEVSAKMHKLFSDISYPMMTNINLAWPVKNSEVYPMHIPDLYQDQPMVISARWPI
ncbi:MAG: marine proteobacterial sortase target protein, partial [Colwellia sp.]|nr:marine proteobacterial sortase target protein [Colwellia sp.]